MRISQSALGMIEAVAYAYLLVLLAVHSRMTAVCTTPSVTTNMFWFWILIIGDGVVCAGAGVWYTPGDKLGGRLGFQITHPLRVVYWGVIYKGEW